jgi:cell division protein FtsW
MNTATMSYGIRARERMPFTWDTLTLGLVAALLLIGLIMVTSASMSIAARNMGDPFYFLERQFIFTMAGVAFAWMVTRIRLRPVAAGPIAADHGADSRPGRARQRRAPLA